METKQCTQCKLELPNNEDYFHKDNAKVKKGHFIILCSKCKKCKNAYNKTHGVGYRKKLIETYGSTYQFSKINNPNISKESQEKNKKYQEKTNERARKWRAEKRESILKANEKSKLKKRIDVEIMTDYYIAKLIFKNNKELSIEELLKNKKLLELHRLNLQLKRIIKNGRNTK